WSTWAGRGRRRRWRWRRWRRTCRGTSARSARTPETSGEPRRGLLALRRLVLRGAGVRRVDGLRLLQAGRGRVPAPRAGRVLHDPRPADPVRVPGLRGLRLLRRGAAGRRAVRRRSAVAADAVRVRDRAAAARAALVRGGRAVPS